MNRKDAIKWLTRLIADIGKESHCDLWHYKQALDEIRMLLENPPEPGWIPVTERLPEKSGRYFVTERIYHINDKEHTGGFSLKTDFAEYSTEEKHWKRADALVVVAWTENKPYRR